MSTPLLCTIVVAISMMVTALPGTGANSGTWSCAVGLGQEGLGAGVGDDAPWPDNGPQFACRHRYSSCDGLYVDVNQSGLDSFVCHQF